MSSSAPLFSFFSYLEIRKTAWFLLFVLSLSKFVGLRLLASNFLGTFLGIITTWIWLTWRLEIQLELEDDRNDWLMAYGTGCRDELYRTWDEEKREKKSGSSRYLVWSNRAAIRDAFLRWHSSRAGALRRCNTTALSGVWSAPRELQIKLQCCDKKAVCYAISTVPSSQTS